MIKKNIVMINSHTRFSTGNIMLGIAECARQQNFNVYTFSPAGRTQRKDIEYHHFIGSIVERRISNTINTITGMQGSLNIIGTLKVINFLKKIKPDIIHFHNLHSNYININLLFKYIKKNNIKIVWTLHDCWAFTGHCPYFDIVQCEKWKTQCKSCNMYRNYPVSFRDLSTKMYEKKKKIFTNIDSITFISPSKWLMELTKQSFLKHNIVKLINNGIDLSIFNDRKGNCNLDLHLKDKFVILGVASAWGIRKGQDRFEKLASELSDNYQIILVGIEKEQVKSEKILCISKTADQATLAEIYSQADIFLNPTREDNFPTVNIEALACGTPVVSYGAGGSAEAFDEKSGVIVNDDNVKEKLEQLTIRNFNSKDCIQQGKKFDKHDKYKEYIELYEKILSE